MHPTSLGVTASARGLASLAAHPAPPFTLAGDTRSVRELPGHGCWRSTLSVPDAIAWAIALDHVRPYVFMVETPKSRGTGVMLQLPSGDGHIGVATALHVVEEAITSSLPIRLTHCASGSRADVAPNQRHCAMNSKADLAMLIVHPGDQTLPRDALLRADGAMVLREGASLGWCGFPSVAPPGRLCFFKGCVSAILSEEASYLVDGVVINGVSGGPAFALEPEGRARLVGIVTAYKPNVSVGVPLPGLGVVRAINSYGALFDLMQKADADASKVELAVAQYEQTGLD